jgi:hypothetical protein
VTLQYLFSLFPRLALLLCLSSFLWPVAAQQAQARPGGRTVCVASVVGHKFDVQTIGVMVFGNKLESVSIKSWGIDGMVESDVSAVLGHHFPVRRIAVSAAALAAYKKGTHVFGRSRIGSLVATLRGSGRSCRYYVIAAPVRGQWSNTNQTYEGLGILKRAGIISQYSMFALFGLAIFDGQSLERIRVPIGISLEGLFKKSDWLRLVDESWWPASAQAAARNARLRAATRTLVSKQIKVKAQQVLRVLTDQKR